MKKILFTLSFLMLSNLSFAETVVVTRDTIPHLQYIGKEIGNQGQIANFLSDLENADQVVFEDLGLRDMMNLAVLFDSAQGFEGVRSLRVIMKNSSLFVSKSHVKDGVFEGKPVHLENLIIDELPPLESTLFKAFQAYVQNPAAPFSEDVMRIVFHLADGTLAQSVFIEALKNIENQDFVQALERVFLAYQKRLALEAELQKIYTGVTSIKDYLVQQLTPYFNGDDEAKRFGASRMVKNGKFLEMIGDAQFESIRDHGILIAHYQSMLVKQARARVIRAELKTLPVRPLGLNLQRTDQTFVEANAEKRAEKAMKIFYGALQRGHSLGEIQPVLDRLHPDEQKVFQAFIAMMQLPKGLDPREKALHALQTIHFKSLDDLDPGLSLDQAEGYLRVIENALKEPGAKPVDAIARDVLDDQNINPAVLDALRALAAGGAQISASSGSSVSKQQFDDAYNACFQILYHVFFYENAHRINDFALTEYARSLRYLLKYCKPQNLSIEGVRLGFNTMLVLRPILGDLKTLKLVNCGLNERDFHDMASAHWPLLEALVIHPDTGLSQDLLQAMVDVAMPKLVEFNGQTIAGGQENMPPPAKVRKHKAGGSPQRPKGVAHFPLSPTQRQYSVTF